MLKINRGKVVEVKVILILATKHNNLSLTINTSRERQTMTARSNHNLPSIPSLHHFHLAISVTLSHLGPQKRYRALLALSTIAFYHRVSRRSHSHC